MNKQDVLNYASEEIRTHQKNNYFQRGYRTAMRRAYDRVKQIDEPKKAVIPQSVADWLEVCKENLAISLFFAMTPDVLEVNNQSAETIYWLKSARNQETFAKAWLYGYEIEKEKLYTVEIPNPHGLGHTVLVKDMYGNIFITYVMNSDWRKSKVSQLTEAEIKKDFDWAWQFAEEVDE